jgi:hypothetical protein
MKYWPALSMTLAAGILAALAFHPVRSNLASAITPVARSAAAAPVPPALVVPAIGIAPAPELAAVVSPAQPATAAEEAAFMGDLRVLAEMDAELAIQRAEQGAERFGASAQAPERRSILIHALSRMGRASEARGEAESMVNECPDSPWVREVERFTGAHRHRNIRLAANGQLEYW